MAATREDHPIVIGVESFGEMTAGDDGHLLSEPQNIRHGPDAPRCAYGNIRLFGTEVSPRVRDQSTRRIEDAAEGAAVGDGGDADRGAQVGAQ